MKNKLMVFLFFLIPGICFALSWEEVEFRGVTSSGKKLVLEYRSEWNETEAGHNYYGTSKYSPLGFCDDGSGATDDEVLRCSATRNGPLTAKYQRANPNDSHAAEMLKKYQRQYRMKGANRVGRGSLDIFLCTEGCQSGVPAVLVEIMGGD